MKKQIIILFLLSIHLQSYCQIRTIPVNCNDSVLLSITGKWKTTNLSKSPGNPQAATISARLDAMHQLTREALPKLVAIEGDYRKNTDYTKELGTGANEYNYISILQNYVCNYENKPVYKSTTGNNFKISINNFDIFWAKIPVVINGMQVFYRCHKIGTWKGADLYEYRDNVDYIYKVLLTRKGELPYKPVSRKQYLDYMITFLDSFYNEAIKNMKTIPDQQQREESILSLKKQKDKDINRYTKEIEINRNNNRLGLPAIVNGIQRVSVNDDEAIFFDDEKLGYILVTVNPSYFKKDIPAYVPQFMMLQFSWIGCVGGIYFKKMIINNYAVDKLQAMIDK